MRRIASLLFLIAVLALSLAIPPGVANAHCAGERHGTVVSAILHDHAATMHGPTHSDKEQTGKKAPDCLLRCLAACAGVTALGPAEPIVTDLAADDLAVRPQLSRDGLPIRPLLPPPQPAFI